MAAHQWQCTICKKKSNLLVSDNPTPPSPNFGSKCKTPSGQHVWQKIK